MHVKAFTPLIQPHTAADINVKPRDDRHFILVPTVCILLLLSLFTRIIHANDNDRNRWRLREMALLTYFTLYVLMWFENDRKRSRTIKVVNFRKRFKNGICNINIAVNRYSSSINTSADVLQSNRTILQSFLKIQVFEFLSAFKIKSDINKVLCVILNIRMSFLVYNNCMYNKVVYNSV